MELKMKNEILEIGQVVNTHGIRGELKIQPWCDDPEIFDELAYIYIDGTRYEMVRSRFHKNCELVTVKGIDTIEKAEKLKNKGLPLSVKCLVSCRKEPIILRIWKVFR